ncbi:MAG: iron complex outermembrane receptor protein [Gammaproteobacteria bacterium]|jgi:iron complex outermembrane receptor protein
MFSKNHIAVLVAGLTLPIINQAHAQIDSASTSQLEEIRVLAHPLAENGTAQTVTILRGDELAREVQFSLGETLSGEAGIQSASFGSAVGRPIIHGLAGARVKTTTDRIDTLDVSVTSGDHAVGVEPFIADQVTVLRGSSTLLYGSGAIGGVVDVSTSRIHSKPIEETKGRVQLRAADNANASNGVFTIDTPLTENVVLHVDGFLSDADDYEIPDFTESSYQIAAEEAEEELGEHDGEEAGHVDEEEAFGSLEGSRSERRGGAFGLSFVNDKGFVGISVSSLEEDYGLVGGHGHEEEGGEDEAAEEEGEGPGMIDLSQRRFDFEAGLNNPFAGVESINVRLGINDYEHNELEPNGEVGTLFSNQAWEGRIELRHASWLGFEGALGLQLGEREFSALGEEAFVPPVDSESLGLFWVGQRALGNSELEAGVRWEKAEHSPTTQGLPDLTFDSFSASLGVVGSINDSLTLSGMADLSSRAPTAEELYSNGPHLATNAFEIGDPNLNEEDVFALTFSAGYGNERFELDTSIYLMQFQNYIYEIATSEKMDELPVFRWQQDDATFTGVNLKGLFHLSTFGGGDFDFNFLFDMVRGELDAGTSNRNLPRIPAARSSVGLSWKSDAWEMGIDYLRVNNQRRVAGFELPTDGYEDLSVFLQRKLVLAGNEINVFLHGRNLTDDEQRHHGSIVKDFAPAPGRRWEVGVRMDF